VVTGVAHASAAEVYNDFAADGKLSCNHSRADLLAVLRSGEINQYGDPLTMTKLRLAVRRQLASGCKKSEGGSSTTKRASLIAAVLGAVAIGAWLTKRGLNAGT
jgi:hypothetical protein